MTSQNSKNFLNFIPILHEPSLPTFKDPEFEQNGVIFPMKMTQPSSATSIAAGKGQLNWHVSQTPSLVSSRRGDDSNGKRLKLKDYLHLNSIEKKNKKSNSITKTQIEPNTPVQFRKTNTQSSITPQQTKSSLQSIALSETTKDMRATDPTQILKQDILKRIQSQMSELNDLAKYVKNDFKVKGSESGAQYLLFNMLNSVVNSSKTYQQIGEQISEYNKKEDQGREKEKDYYWNNSKRSLESPAKMLKKGLEFTFNLMQRLQKRH